MDNSTHDEIVSLYVSGLYPRAIRERTHYSLSQIYRVLHAAGVKIRTQAESHRRYQFDFDFFARIDSHVKAQVLGFIAADGCVTDRGTIVIGIAEEDKSYLDFIKNAMRFTGPIRVYPSRRPNEQATAHLNLCCPKTVADITALGCGPRKSLTLQFPTEEQVPTEFISSYMLGYFEGDGSLSWTQRKNRPKPECTWTIASTESFCRDYAQHLGLEPGVGIVPPGANNKIAMLRVNGNRKIKRVMEYLYANASYVMPRKRAIYDQLVKQLEHLDTYGWTVPSRRKHP